MTSNIRGMSSFRISVSSEMISSATFFAKGKIRCTRSQRPEGIWSYLFCSFRSLTVKRYFQLHMHEDSTNLIRDGGNTKNCLCNWVQLLGVNVLLASHEYGTTDL